MLDGLRTCRRLREQHVVHRRRAPDADGGRMLGNPGFSPDGHVGHIDYGVAGIEIENAHHPERRGGAVADAKGGRRLHPSVDRRVPPQARFGIG